MKRRSFALLLSLSLAMPAPAAVNLPDLGDVAASELSPQAERHLGESVIRQIRWHDAAYLDDPEVEGYLNRLGRRLVAASRAPDQDFEFFAVKDPTLNAFALPGGYIGVHTGLILAAESESELASVLGHEIGHVTQRHIAQMVGKQSQAGIVMLASILVAVLAARSSSQVSEAAVAAGQAGAMQSQLAYSRDFEREADRVGLQTLEGAGFDVRGMPSFFERLQRESRFYENNAPAYLRTHPLTTERIADMENRVAQLRYRQVVDSEDFRLVRAKLRAGQGAPADAVKDMQGQVAAKPDDVALRYGLARALLRAGRIEEADRAAADLIRNGDQSAMIATLAADVRLAKGDAAGAAAILEAGRKRFPLRFELVYAEADALLRAGRTKDAMNLIRERLAGHGDDVRLWTLLAQANAGEGRRAGQHRAQAEVYALQGQLPAAIEQLQLARKAGDADFYELSAMDARMRELKARLEEERKDEKR